jgi:hypothetical protein
VSFYFFSKAFVLGSILVLAFILAFVGLWEDSFSLPFYVCFCCRLGIGLDF